MPSPLISVIVPCYNQAQYLDECLQSVLDQTFSDWECIIVNDGSPDNTEELAKNWIQKDSRFKYLYKENGGVASARNYAISYAQGEWILPLDGDDKISEKYLELAEEKFCENPTIIYCEAEYFGEKNGENILDDYSLEKILLQNLIFCTAFYKKSDWLKVGGYDLNMIYGLEDWEFWISILTRENKKVIKIPYLGFFYRIKLDSRSVSLKGNKIKMMIDYINKKHIDLYFEIYGNHREIIRNSNKMSKKLHYFENSKLHKLTSRFLKIFYKTQKIDLKRPLSK